MPPTLLLVAALAAAPAAPPEATAQLEVGLVSMTSDVHGGDGDHIPASWTLHVDLELHNTGDEPVTVTGGSFVLPLDGGVIKGRSRGGSLELVPGESARLVLHGYVPIPLLYVLREDLESQGERSPRRITGQLDLEVSSETRYTPFTVVGRYRGVFDQMTTVPDP